MEEPRRRSYLAALSIDSFARRDAPAAAVPLPPSQPLQIAEPPPPPRERAPVPGDWEGLAGVVAACRLCRLCETRTQTVFGVGARRAPLMVIGEGPGADEDARGEPFVGRAGKLLDQMLAAIGRSRAENVYIANVVKCRPPQNREPAEDEAEACRAYLEQQIRLVQPRLLVALGRTAAQRLLATDVSLSKLRGQVHAWGPDATPLLITYHPAYLLRNPRDKARSWEDLKRIDLFLTRGSLS